MDFSHCAECVILNQCMKDTTSDSKTAPFFIPGGEPGILLIHGFLSAPDEVRPLGEFLAAAGMTVCGICLRGHGTIPEDLAQVHWQDWVGDVKAGLNRLRKHCERLGIAGISLGAALALYVATEEPVEKIVGFATPGRSVTRRIPPSWIAHIAHAIPFVPKIGSDMHDAKARRERFIYRRIPLHATAEMANLFEALEGRLPEIQPPTLFVHARHDRVVPAHSVLQIAARLSARHELVWLDRGGHSVTLDSDRQRAWQAARSWFLDTRFSTA